MTEFDNELDMQAFAKRLKAARCEQGLTLEALANACNVTSVHIRHMEDGSRLPSLPVFICICKALRVSPNYFLGDYVEPALADGLPDAYEHIVELLLKLPPRQAEMIVAMIQTMADHLE